MRNKKSFGCVLAVVITVLLAGCANVSVSVRSESDSNEASTTAINVACLKGPTAIGLVHLMDSSKQLKSENNYNFNMYTGADEILPQMVSGDMDIALVPANVACVLYNKTKGAVSVMDINTLGVLNAVSGDESVDGIASLSGRTVYLTGKGTTPDYVLNYLLSQNEVSDVTLEYKSEPTEVVAILTDNPDAIGILPQPFATASTMKNQELKIVMSLTEEWDKLNSESSMVTGVTVVRNDFLKENPEACIAFLNDHKESVYRVLEDVDKTAQLCVDAGIMDNPNLAKAAIPECNVTCIDGDELKTRLSGYLKVLYEADPTSVGGALPGDDFYYESKAK